jgi:LysM repeat protein
LIFFTSYNFKNNNKSPLFTFGSQINGGLFVDQKKISFLESPDLTLIQKNTLFGTSSLATLSPKVLGSLIGSFDDSSQGLRREIIEYTVKSEDNLWKIANKFEISLNSLLWANNLSKNSLIRPGQKLIILPVSGIIYQVKPGDTLSEIAKKYKGKTEEIIVFNNLSEEGNVYIGDILIIPNGVMPIKTSPVQYIPLAKTYSISPISSPFRITQGLHWYNAIDFSNGKCGGPVYAVAGGTVQKTGYQRIPGKYIRILHPNGIVTFYGHLSSILAARGEKVFQGQIIGHIGYTGYTIPRGPRGCHLHFGVRGAKNPFAR